MADTDKVPFSSLWQLKCQTAERESDPKKLAPLVIEAENAIFVRLQEIAGTETPEHEAIRAAVRSIRQIQVTKLNFPRWEQENSTPRPA